MLDFMRQSLGLGGEERRASPGSLASFGGGAAAGVGEGTGEEWGMEDAWSGRGIFG
jgi:hypothetical protein